MGEDAFNENILTEKLSKLNSSQQSIESLSRWCIIHRKKAKHVVERWETLFKSASRDQRVSLLYLANDILQNSRRKGSEFVNEFWKVLPAALKGVFDSGEESSKKVAHRLVEIWEERKVFGSRGQNLKNEVLGKNSSPGKNPSLDNGKNSNPNPIKVVKRDANSLRIKLAVGGFPEKILTAFQLVHDETVSEEVALKKCRNAVSCVEEMERDFTNVPSQGNLLHPDALNNIEKQEKMLRQCISQLEKVEAVRVGLVSQLKEAVQDQESKLELIRSELLVARSQIEQAANTKLRLASISSAPSSANQLIVEPTFPPALPTNNPTATPPTSFVNPTISEEESNRAAAAAVAAKLTASMSSAQMLTSVLSSLVAEEAASMTSGLKRPKLEKPLYYADANNPERPGTQCISQVNQLQAPFLPPLPPPPLPPPGNSPGQSSIMGLPYVYGASNLQHPPPPSNVSVGNSMPGPPVLQANLQNQQPQSLQQQQQQQPANGGYYRPVGVGFYGQSHQPPTPPIHRQ